MRVQHRACLPLHLPLHVPLHLPLHMPLHLRLRLRSQDLEGAMLKGGVLQHTLSLRGVLQPRLRLRPSGNNRRRENEFESGWYEKMRVTIDGCHRRYHHLYHHLHILYLPSQHLYTHRHVSHPTRRDTCHLPRHIHTRECGREE